MSWDDCIVRFSQAYESLQDVPQDESPLPLGSTAEVRTAVSSVFPETDWSDPAWGVYFSDLGSIEFSLGDDEPATSLMLHVRASAAIVAPIVELLKKQNWNGIDGSTGQLLEMAPDPTEGIEGWRAFRDRAFGDQ